MKRVTKKRWISIGLMFSFCLLLSCSGLGKPQTSKFILLSSTIGPIDAGIVGLLENEFEKDTGIRVRHVGSGTGAALDIARKGNVDLVLVHAKSLEEKFVNEGFGTERIDLMYNDFVIVGPSDDPAGIKGMKLATEALRKISEKKATFISRGDKSGTHVAEMELWGKAGIKPSGSWYVVYEKGATGNVPTLRYTDEKSAYTVIDRATYLTLKTQIKLAVLVEKDEALLNYMSLIPVNPQKFSKVNYGDVMVFVKWLTSPKKGQRIIRDFGKDKYGTSLFFPNSKEWRMAQGTKN
jgi:tungstate transport system substrate-binding protein